MILRTLKENLENSELSKKQLRDSLELKLLPMNFNLEFSIILIILANNYVQLKLNSIMIYKLQTGRLIPVIKKVARPISIAEKLGIPKAMRSSAKALEDPYY